MFTNFYLFILGVTIYCVGVSENEVYPNSNFIRKIVILHIHWMEWGAIYIYIYIYLLYT